MDTFVSLLSRRGLSYDRLLNFCRIAEAGGISKAADGDAAKQSLYSRQIRELEEFFDFQEPASTPAQAPTDGATGANP